MSLNLFSLTLHIQSLDNKSVLKSKTRRQCKIFAFNDSKQLSSRHFFDKRMGTEIDGEILGEQFKGYIFKITGGNDKQGFPMKQGVLVNGRVRLLMKGSIY